MWKILICDDDNNFLQSVKMDILSLYEGRTIDVQLFEGKDQLMFYVEGHPDEANIVLLDIKLRDGSGIDLARDVLCYQPQSQIIFISAYDSYYLDVYDVEHVYFLQKPIKREFLHKAIQRAEVRLKDISSNSFVVFKKSGSYKIPYNDILYFENELRRIHIYTAEEKISYYGRFEDLAQQLDERFKRCHNSYIVNISKVKALENKSFRFENGRVVPISRTYYPEIKKSFFEYLDKVLLKNNVKF